MPSSWLHFQAEHLVAPRTESGCGVQTSSTAAVRLLQAGFESLLDILELQAHSSTSPQAKGTSPAGTADALPAPAQQSALDDGLTNIARNLLQMGTGLEPHTRL